MKGGRGDFDVPSVVLGGIVLAVVLVLLPLPSAFFMGSLLFLFLAAALLLFLGAKGGRRDLNVPSLVLGGSALAVGLLLLMSPFAFFIVSPWLAVALLVFLGVTSGTSAGRRVVSPVGMVIGGLLGGHSGWRVGEILGCWPGRAGILCSLHALPGMAIGVIAGGVLGGVFVWRLWRTMVGRVAIVVMVVTPLVFVEALDRIAFEPPASSSPPLPPFALEWSRIPHDESVFGGLGYRPRRAVMTSVTEGGPGFVAVGHYLFGAAVWTSSDGITWSRVPHDPSFFDRVSLTSVTSGGPGVVAVGKVAFATGSIAAVWTSPDGITWSRVPHDESVFGSRDSGARMTSVTVGGPGLVAVGALTSYEPTVWTSPDGITWSRIPLLDEPAFAILRDVTAGGPGLVAVGEYGSTAAVWTSPDGISWSRVPHDERVFAGRGGSATWMWSVTAGGPGLVAVGRAEDWGKGIGAVWTSADGITWSRVPHDELVFGNTTWMTSVTTVGPGLVAIGKHSPPGPAMWASADGISWSRLPLDEAVFADHLPSISFMFGLQDVTAGGPGLVAVGGYGVGGSGVAAAWVAEFDLLPGQPTP